MNDYTSNAGKPKFLNSLLGDIVAIIPTRLALINLSLRMEEFILIVERVK